MALCLVKHRDSFTFTFNFTHLYIVPTLRMRGAIPLLPHIVFMAWCLVKHRHRDLCL